MPPLAGSRCELCVARQPRKMWNTPSSSRTGKCNCSTESHALICSGRPGGRSRWRSARSTASDSPSLKLGSVAVVSATVGRVPTQLILLSTYRPPPPERRLSRLPGSRRAGPSSIGSHGEDRSRRRAASVGLTELGSPTILTLLGASVTLGKTYRYRFKVDGRVVYVGITTDLQRREREHQRRWPGGVIEQVGQPTSHRDAWEWERQQASPGSATAV